MKKLSVCVLFGGMSPEHEVSLRSAESVLNNMDHEKYNIFPVGIKKDGDWVLYAGTDYSLLPTGEWEHYPENRRATISPVRGQGLLQMAGIPYVGPHISASAVAMDKTLTKLVADHAGVPQASWQLVRTSDLECHMDTILDQVEKRFTYPVFVKPAGTGSSVGVSKAADREKLKHALVEAGAFDTKILVEEFIRGREVEVAVMGNANPVASECGEIDSGAEFYDYESKYITNTSTAYIPARIPEDVAEQVREMAVKVYTAIGCQGLSRVDFFVTYDENRVVFNEINTIPGFTSISMFPKLFSASGIPYDQLIDELLRLALEACK